jgi:pSer/pThr/pTyr-binding forkhead associated (FHA) protein/tetratricopeptide (TPR) repeat protein
MKLTFVDSSGRERAVELTTKPQVFGRGEDSDVVLGSRSVSRHHMKMWLDGDKVMVEDLTGGQGIKVDGVAVSGTFELEPGADMQLGVFTVAMPGGGRKTASDLAALGEEAPPVPMLHGTRGPTKGLEIELQEGHNDVGRDPNLYLVIEDPSVSRQHARLSVEAGKFTVIDMRSSNGTFVNGQRVEQALLRSGDMVRFGNLEFRFTYGKALGRAPMPRKKKLLLFGGGGLVFLLLVMVVAKNCGGPPPAPVSDEPEEGPRTEVIVDQLIRQAKGYLDEDPMDLRAALDAVQKCLDLDPINKDCRRLRTEVEDETAAKSIYDQCVIEFDLNRWRVALDCYLKLPEKSRFMKKSKYKLEEARKQLSKYHLGEAKGYHNANQFRKAHDHYVEYMKLNPCDLDVYRQEQKNEQKMKGQWGVKYTPFVLACQEGGITEADLGADPEDAIRRMYPNKQIGDAMLKYFNGKSEPAIVDLQRLLVGKDAGVSELARRLMGDVRVVRAKYNEGQSLMNRGKAKEAKEQLDTALEIDARLMPKGVMSFFREDMGKLLAGRLYKDGLELYNRKELEAAFKVWSECLQRWAAETDCKRGLSMLEEVADRMMDEVERLERQEMWSQAAGLMKEVLIITAPEAMSHKQAKKKLREYD